MTQTRPVQTKALSAYLNARGSSLIAALSQVGVDLAFANDATISDDVVGRIARRYGLEPAKLIELAEAHATV